MVFDKEGFILETKRSQTRDWELIKASYRINLWFEGARFWGSKDEWSWIYNQCWELVLWV